MSNTLSMNSRFKSFFLLVSINRKHLIYLFSTVGICWIGVWRDIGNGAQWAFANNCIGFCLLPMILCRFSIKDFLKLPYAVWSVVYTTCAIPICRDLLPGTDYNAQIISGAIIAGLYGLIAIRLFIYIFIEKSVQKKNLSIIFWLWLGMMLFCCISRNMAFWPFWYLVMFGTYYLAPVSKSDMMEMVKGIADGIIISFFWVQSRAFLYRPYDYGGGGRYVGHFTNSNVNAMFYQLSLSGLLTRFWIVSKSDVLKGTIKKVVSLLLFFLSVSILDFVFYTGSRGAMLSTFGMIAIYIVADAFYYSNKRLRTVFMKSLMTMIVIIVMLYPVYACIRYIPALRHHPIWYRDYSESKVHSFDPIDSDKYVSFEDALNAGGLSRAIGMFKSSDIDSGFVESSACSLSRLGALGIEAGLLRQPLLTPVVVKEYPGGTWVYEYDDGVEPGTDNTHSAFINVEWDKVKSVRFFIWKYFIERLNFLGHEEVYISIYAGDFFGHAHNTFLQIAYLFGVPAGLLFVLIVICGIVLSFNRLLERKDVYSIIYFFPLVFLSGYFIFGLVECLALTGEAVFTIMFLTLDILVNNSNIPFAEQKQLREDIL